MKFTLSWLKEYLKTNASLDEVCKTLTNIGLEVENVVDEAESLKYFEVAKILSAKNHENSAKLKICEVEVLGAAKPLQIICGASNARAGIKVAYAPIGAVIPVNQMVIKKAKIAGTESNGMLCSARELGLGDADEGIIEIDEKWEVGTKIADIYNKSDAQIEINVTPNRGDCLGVYGIARDLAAAGLGELQKLPTIKNKVEFAADFKVKNSAVEACKAANFRKISRVKNCESPKWLKDKLESVGLNSISALVDITNYSLIAFNRPLHAYDASKINGSINIRFAKNGEKFVSLKGEEYKLSEEILTIADDEKVLAIAGVTGSNNSGCDLETKDIILESAYFDAVAVAKSGRKLNILSDSRYRFERGIDPLSCEFGIEFATQLILEICGGKVSEIVAVEGEDFKNKNIEFDFNFVKKLTGLEVPKDKACEILENLEFKVSGNVIEVPSFRSDVSIKQDLVEEIVRIYGYNKIAPQKLENISPNSEIDFMDKVRSLLVANGMVENINWSFCSKELVKYFAEEKSELILSNPISSDLDHMRPNLIVGLLKSYQKNYLRSFVNSSSFEIGNVFEGVAEKLQRLMIAGVRAGKNKDKNHYLDARDFDIFDVKKDLFDVLEIFGLKSSSLQISDFEAPKYYHPHRSGTLKLGKNIIGYFGEIHPKINKIFDVKTTINAFEIFADNLPKASASIVKKPYVQNDLQQIERDFAFLVDKNMAVGEMIKTIQNCDKQLIKQVDIFDIYSGKNIDEDKKSVALRVIIQPTEKTLTSEEIEVLSQKIISSLKNSGAELRS